jgi:hypothetical protein
MPDNTPRVPHPYRPLLAIGRKRLLSWMAATKRITAFRTLAHPGDMLVSLCVGGGLSTRARSPVLANLLLTITEIPPERRQTGDCTDWATVADLAKWCLGGCIRIH